jgi:molecular chaperone DnaK (HSP70)
MKRFVVGIDLGTTNSALAYVDPADGELRVRRFEVPQLVREGTLDARHTLPSFLYVAGEHDVAPGGLALPWDEDRGYAVGEFARRQGARVPGRLVSSAKSWLCHGGVDREEAILPWGADDSVSRLSPVEASARYLQHLREAWEQSFPAAPLAQQDVVLTVPASFDEVARELTVAAAERAGLSHAVLVEEPLAAFYAWLHQNEDSWEASLAPLRLVVVIDVGGGTTDFTLVSVREVGGRVALERLAVGDHLLLGGDNFDVALARALEPRLGVQLDSQRWHALASQCCAVKEQLLGAEAPAEAAVRVVGRGRSVVGSAVTGTLARDEVQRLVVDGFFPIVDAQALPRRDTRVALQEWGLPFADDPEVSRHLAAFLQRHAADTATLATAASDTPTSPGPQASPTWPDAVLFNGGALKPPIIRERLVELLRSWSGQEPTVLQSVDLDLAVARGAAYYGLVRRGQGVRVAGGSARAYYLGLEPATAGPEEATQPVRALCVAHRGMQEGEQLEIDEPAFDVIANRGVAFPLYASSVRLGDRTGQMLSLERESLTELPPIRTVLRFGKKLTERKLPVHIVTHLTEVGTMELWFRSLSTEHRWRLQFHLRQALAADSEATGSAQTEAESVVSDTVLAPALEALGCVFPADGSPARGDPVGLVRVIEQHLDTGKDAWPLEAIRKLWDQLWEGRQHRRVSAAHEGRWLNLSGFLLRPGFGAELDDWRIQNLWRMRSDGLHFPKTPQCRVEWWNMWKRVAGGLSRPQQLQLHAEVAPHLLPRLKAKAKAKAGGVRPGPQEQREYWQLMASCERLSADIKAELGDVLLSTVRKGKTSEAEIWALGRLGARAPFYGPLNCVVERSVAERWVQTLLAGRWNKPAALAFTLMQLARCVADRERDLDAGLRQTVAGRLRSTAVGERGARAVTEVVPVAAAERARILDESLPVGLQLRDADA